MGGTAGIEPSRQTVYSPEIFTSVVVTTAPPTSPTPIGGLPASERLWLVAELASPTPTPTPSATAAPRHQPQPRARAEPKATSRPSRTSPSKGNSSVAAARQYALERLGSRQFACLDVLVERESGWRVTAGNKSSGAYGLPQALPGRKMAKYGSDWRTNATTQLRWMVAYVNGRYGSACQALSHARSTGWY